MSLALLLVILIVYCLPTMVAAGRGHRSAAAIFILNLLLGWTVLGWIGALIWASTGDVQANQVVTFPGAQVKCPDCAELVKAEARVCKHCGRRLEPKLPAAT